jgi:hypothetical protein
MPNLAVSKSLTCSAAIIEGTVNFLVNRRMNNSQQMRWSPRDQREAEFRAYQSKRRRLAGQDRPLL